MERYISSPPIYYYQHSNDTRGQQYNEQLPYQIHYVNTQPYVCYNCQPEILHPVYHPEHQVQPVYPVYLPQPLQNERLLPELAAVFVNDLQKLEDNAQKYEQELINKANEKVKTYCYDLLKKYILFCIV